MTRLALRSTVVALVLGAATIAAGAERVVTLSVADGPRPVTIEWRALGPTGTRLVASREVTLQGRVPVTVPDGPSVIRVVEAEARPGRSSCRKTQSTWRSCSARAPAAARSWGAW